MVYLCETIIYTSEVVQYYDNHNQPSKMDTTKIHERQRITIDYWQHIDQIVSL